ncbi:hypothetical protein Mal64_30190 [Pseudobythopirellula maris]|uniref:Uncharacterized protein n=1 Tax=Pseudobythopirellula maris TaxID=2527991 RepID=A0A5C5ZJU4_9BACT|nr:DUF480 domain-containing protein [Pseudobythopirellula maris]TWT87480.1 hypothetical protein Mal64_30190 [Pseudobythopirellula maris]
MTELADDQPKWTTLASRERRILGALVEKAKTTPDAYPLSLNALRSACNQKSNRSPQMTLDEDQIDEAIDALRQKGAVSVVQGDSRVERYRHLAYDWLGVDKTELAVMAELLLRGEQTVGELRGRAARMEPIKGISELEPVLVSLKNKGLLLYLSPPGRGAVVTHNLYGPSELDRLKRDLKLDDGAPAAAATPAAASSAAPTAPTPQAAPPAPAPADSDWRPEFAALRAEFEETITELRDEIETLRQRVEG